MTETKETFYNKSFANNWKLSNIEKPHLFRSTSLVLHIFCDNTFLIHNLAYIFCISLDQTAQNKVLQKRFPSKFIKDTH